MLSLREHFLRLLCNIQPKADRLTLAKELPAKIREFLEDTEKILTISPHTRLSGSYGRDTAIKSIKDVDILIFIDPSYKNGSDSTKNVINNLVNALRGLPDALGDEYGYVDAELALKRQRRSVLVHITLNEEEFDMDIVPAILDEDTDNPLSVPDRVLSKWISSDPLGYKQALSKLNREQNEKIVPLIKMFKHWRDVQMKYHRPKSYWLECMVYKHAKAAKLKIDGSSHGELFQSLLQAIYDDYIETYEKEGAVPTIKDPMLGNNVAKSWTRAEFETFIRQIGESKRWAERALEAEFEAAAIKLWQNIFNGDDDNYEYFPTQVEDSLKSMLAGNSVYITTTGQVYSQKPSSEKSWQPPQHRYFGQENETS